MGSEIDSVYLYITPVRTCSLSFPQHITSLFCLILMSNQRKYKKSLPASPPSEKCELKTPTSHTVVAVSNLSDIVMCCSRKCKCVLWFRVKGNKQMYHMSLWLKGLI